MPSQAWLPPELPRSVHASVLIHQDNTFDHGFEDSHVFSAMINLLANGSRLLSSVCRLCIATHHLVG